MEIDKALSQISEIHAHVARAEVYRDVKALPVAISGGLALLAAPLQPLAIGPAPGVSFIFYWIGVAAFCALVAGGGIVRDYFLRPDPLGHLRTRIVSGQFTPCLAAGGLVTMATLFEPRLLPHLPGLWSILFSLGIFAARPYLPRMIGYAAAWYLGAGGALLALVPSGNSLSPWGMGLVFGVGQILSGLILYWNLERGDHDKR
jgi:hypothetical protein